MFLKMLPLIVVFTIFYVTCVKGGHHSLSDEFINEINNKQSLWKAGRNFHPDTPITNLRRLLGVKKQSKIDYSKLKLDPPNLKKVDLPAQLDWREKFPACTSLNMIYDQANCGSCWAVSSASVMSDRLCIHSNGTDQRLISAVNLLSCCNVKYDIIPYCGFGCDGGEPVAAFSYWNLNGIVTGGPYKSNKGCQDYAFAPCSHHPSKYDVYPDCVPPDELAPDCSHSCDNSSLNYGKELTFASQSYIIHDFETELFTNGPVVASFYAFEDFFNYKSGIYKYTQGNFIGAHAVRVLGWGIENNVSYWLVANSWNEEWGDNGTFKILKGTNECGFESEWVSGLPKLT